MQESTKDIIRKAGFDFDSEGIVVPEVDKLTKDMKKLILNCESPTKAEIRTLVNLYYQIQDIRIAVTEQIRSISKEEEKAGRIINEGNLVILSWVDKSVSATEKGIKDSLQKICEANEVGRWLLGIKGIGPSLAAGCLAYFDVEDKQYASTFISYAGLNDNNRPWLGREKSKKIVQECIDEFSADGKTIDMNVAEHISARSQWKMSYLMEKAYDERKEKFDKEKIIKACSMTPYNAQLKKHMWLVGKSFEYQKSRPDSVYGRLLTERIAQEIQRNEKGLNKDLIEKRLQEKNYSRGTKTYESYMEGKLPDPEINARARRWVEKIFISHLFDEMYRVRYDKVPPRYYALEHVEGHHDFIEPEVPFYVVSEEK